MFLSPLDFEQFTVTISSVSVDREAASGEAPRGSEMAFGRSPVCILDVDVHPLGCSEELWNEQRERRRGR